jgi:hypothetical protein
MSGLDCNSLKFTLPAHALGGLDTAEKDEVGRHLASCPACRAEEQGIADLVSLLGALTTAEAAVSHLLTGTDTEPAADAAPVAQAAHESATGHASWWAWGRGRGLRVLVVAAAIVATVAGGLAVYGRPTRSVPSAAAALRIPAGAVDERNVSASDGATGTKAVIQAVPQGWGTWVQLTLTRQTVLQPEMCQLVVVGRDGQRQVAATWEAAHNGTFTIPGSAGMSPDQVAHYEVDTLDGRRLIAVPA